MKLSLKTRTFIGQQYIILVDVLNVSIDLQRKESELINYILPINKDRFYIRRTSEIMRKHNTVC